MPVFPEVDPGYDPGAGRWRVAVAGSGRRWVTEACDLLAGALDRPGGRIDPADDFFALGGTSQQLLRLGAEIERRHGVEIDIGDLLDRPTAAQLAGLLADRVAAAPGGTERTAG